MRLIDADELLKNVEYDEYYHSNEIKAMIDAMPIVSFPPNPPLTLEELREMDGEPVWICNSDGSCKNLALVDVDYEVCRIASGGFAMFYCYNNTWIAYKMKLDETV